jgi:hypothetical protein
MSGLVRAHRDVNLSERGGASATALVLDRTRLSPDSDHRTVLPLRRNIARWFCKLGIEDSIPNHRVLPHKARTIS